MMGCGPMPGWWSRTSNLIPLMQSSVVSLQAMNPGLIIRSHWIRTMSFGRLTLSSAADNKPVAMVSSAFAML